MDFLHLLDIHGLSNQIKNQSLGSRLMLYWQPIRPKKQLSDLLNQDISIIKLQLLLRKFVTLIRLILFKGFFLMRLKNIWLMAIKLSSIRRPSNRRLRIKNLLFMILLHWKLWFLQVKENPNKLMLDALFLKEPWTKSTTWKLSKADNSTIKC